MNESEQRAFEPFIPPQPAKWATADERTVCSAHLQFVKLHQLLDQVGMGAGDDLRT